jgi:hypothetical protein
MAGRDDFGSGMKSPGGWGGSGGGMGGGMGGGKSSSNYNYSSNAGQRGPAIGNWNTGGAVVGFGNQFGVNGMGENNLGKGPWPGGYAQPVLQKRLPSLLGIPQPGSYPPPPVTQEDIPGVMPQQPVAPDRNYPVPPRYVQPTRPMAPNVYGQPPQAMPRPNTTIPYNPNGGGYTNIYKNNQGNLPGYPGGNQATYNKMGGDFRSVSNW